MATRAAKTTIAKPKTVKTTAPKVKAVKEASLDKFVFGYQVSDKLLAQALHVYADNDHQHTSKAKTRGEVNIVNKKVYKQKGTGNARHGAKSAPIYVGGGVAHGPKGIKANRKSLNKKVRAAALAGILALYAKEKHLDLIVAPELKKPSAKAVKSIFSAKNSLLVTGTDMESLTKSSQNLANLTVTAAAKLNAYVVSKHRHIYLTTSAHDQVVARLTPLLNSKKK